METEMTETVHEETLPDGLPAPGDVLPQVEETMDVTQRLAEDFLDLAEEFPQFVHPGQLPDAVLDMAAQQGISLLDAYLRYRLQEEKKVVAAAQKRQQAAEQSTGSLSRGAIQTPPEQDAFLRAFRAAL